jgi:hypothetical protein
MSQPDRLDATPEPETRPEGPDAPAAPEADGAAGPAPPEKAPPEPMTPEKVAAWNRYLDRYVAGGVILLAFLAACRPIAGNSGLFTYLRAGELTARQGPLTADPFSYTEAGQRWVNVPWLFELVSWEAFSLGGVLAPRDPARALQIGGTVLVALNAALLGIAAAVLMGVRRPGPGLWWAASCVMLALGGSVFPGGPYGVSPVIGGLGFRDVSVSPESWGVLLLCVELLLIHRAVNQGRVRALYGLPLVFLLWANLDASFLYGLLVAALWLAGSLVRPPARAKGDPPPPGVGPSLGVLAACALACLANPSTYQAYLVAFDPYADMVKNLTGNRGGVPLTYDQISFFDPESQAYFDKTGGPGTARMYAGYYLLVVWAGLLSFAVNWRRFALGRFLAYLAAALLWAGLSRLSIFFAPLLASVLILNGQEWYHARYGTEGRLGPGWKLFSDGGRAATILVVFGFLAIAITGYTNPYGEAPFGFGVQTGTFAFETAEHLRDSGVEGKVLNLTLAHGDALVWADPIHKSFIDNRSGLFPDSLRLELKALRAALADDDKATWAPILDREGISVVMVSPSADPAVLTGLRNSPADWVPIYDGGNAVLFGRVDQPGPDRDRFLAGRLQADELVYKRAATVEIPDRPPAPNTWIDKVVRTRSGAGASPQVAAAGRWLGGFWSASRDEPPDPARCFMAIREARAALHANPDDDNAFYLLYQAYSALNQAEQSILQAGPKGDAAAPPMVAFRSAAAQERLSARAPLTPPGDMLDAFRTIQDRFVAELMALNPDDPRANASGSASVAAFRFRQRLASLYYAIQTAPDPQDIDARRLQAGLHLSLADLYLGNQVLDLAVEHLRQARALLPPAELPEAVQLQLDQLSEQAEAARAQLDDLAAQDQAYANPVALATQAVQFGLLGLAIEQLNSVEGFGISEVQVRPLLVDLYCRVGRPDEAFNLLETIPPADPSLSTGPGSGPYRQGLVYLLLGYYPITREDWEAYAIPMVRQAQVFGAVSGGRSLLTGDPLGAVNQVLQITGTPGSDGLTTTQANWEAELGLAKLEAGMPQDVKDDRGVVVQKGALGHFLKALELAPDLPSRPLLAYYIEKLGGTVPPEPEPEPVPVPEASPSPEPSPDAGAAAEPNAKAADEAGSGPGSDAQGEAEPKGEPAPDPDAGPKDGSAPDVEAGPKAG